MGLISSANLGCYDCGLSLSLSVRLPTSEFLHLRLPTCGVYCVQALAFLQLGRLRHWDGLGWVRAWVQDLFCLAFLLLSTVQDSALDFISY